MVFEAKDFGQIFADMRDRTPAQLTDFEEGSVVRTLYESFSYELALLYEQMHRVYLSAFVDTATGGELDRVVAILGIKRGEPDFATGLVTFERDLGIAESIEIPLGFLITTSDDTEESPKKAFLTIETKTLTETDKRVQVRVQAAQRGEAQATEANTIQVMPQPLPGVKAVTNEQAIRFVGKRRETDDELRDRAKTALLAASGANITAIENALFSLPGVTEVRVRENFHYARGMVQVSRHNRSYKKAITVPQKTQLRLQTGERRFVTLAAVTLEGDVTEATVEVEARTRGIAGQRPQGETVSWQSISQVDSEGRDLLLDITDVEPIVLRDFGVLDVFVDGVDFTNAAQLDRLNQEVERVRAAGIYVLLKPARVVTLDATFQIELVPGKRIAPEERIALEATLQAALKAYIADQRMGQPLLIAQLTKEILASNLVNDLVDFRLTTYRSDGVYQEATQHNASAKRLDVDLLEKIVPRYIRVASETKPLIVDVTVKARSLGPDEVTKTTARRQMEQAIWDYFGGLGAGLAVRKETLQTAQVLANDVEITLAPHFWQPLMAFDGQTVEVSFVEQAQLGNVFIYESTLNLNGALKLMASLTATQDEKTNLQDRVRLALEHYLDHLKPEEAVDLEQLAAVAQGVDGVLQVDWRVADVRVSRTQAGTTTPLTNRIDGTILQVNPFEKTRLLPEFAIATDIRRVPVSVQRFVLRLDITGQIPAGVNQAELRSAMEQSVRHGLNTIHLDLTPPEVGKTPAPESFATDLQAKLQAKVGALSRTMIQSLAPKMMPSLRAGVSDALADLTKTCLQGATYVFEQLDLTPSSTDLVIRLVEQAQIQPIAPGNVIITLELPLPPPPP